MSPGLCQRAHPGPRRPGPALPLRHVPQDCGWHTTLRTGHHHQAMHVTRRDALHEHSTRGDPSGGFKLSRCLEIPSAALQ